MITTIAVLTLIIINSVVGVLLLLDKIRLVIVRPEPGFVQRLELPISHAVAPIDPVKRGRGRPKKRKGSGIRREYFCPASVTESDILTAKKFLLQHQADSGDLVILHDKDDHKIEIPHPVAWSPDVKAELDALFGGWA